jgi:hypothetical protein
LEEYIESRVLRQVEMRDPLYVRMIALELGKFHGVEMSGVIDKVPLMVKYLDEDGPIL